MRSFTKAADADLSLTSATLQFKPAPDPDDDEHVSTVLASVVRVILFLPRVIVYRPIASLVYVVTYPIRIIIYLLFYRVNIQEAVAADDSNDVEKSPKHADDDITFEVADKGDDQIKSPTSDSPKHEPIMKSSVQGGSPTPVTAQTPSKPPHRHRHIHKKTFIFPRLLFNFSLSHPPNIQKKTLVLDLDETLIHSLSRYNSSILTKHQGVTVEVRLNNSSLTTLYHIYKRPHVDEFLAIVRHWFNLVCFTASIKEYADPVINYLEKEVMLKDKSAIDMRTEKVFSRRFYRESCIFIEGKGYVKDLSVLTNTPTNTPSPSRHRRSRHTDLSKIIIVDNSPISYSHHKDNGVMIEGWINDPNDVELMALLPLLNGLRFTSDVRTILGLKNGQAAFR